MRHPYHKSLPRDGRAVVLLLAAAVVLGAASGRAASASAVARAPRPPNFLFIYTDDQRWDAMGVVQREQGDKARFPWFQTPHMDRLAAGGVRFRNAFVVHSLCSPSRAAFLTGRYSHLHGIVNNHTPFAATSVTHATVLRAAGYTTAYIGKWHMGSQRGHRAGFDYSASFVGQGRYVDCPFEINGEPTPTSGWVDDVSTDYAIAFMQEHRDKPFLAIVGFKATHTPFRPPARAQQRFAEARARAVPNLGVRAIYFDRDARFAARIESEIAAGAGGTERLLRYFRCISAADDNLGRLLGALEELGLADDTVVVFTSDNGFYHGEHGLLDKRSAYDESLRIPLLVRYPRLFPKNVTRDELVLNIDVAPTFIDLAGTAVPVAMQGRSWRPLLTGKHAPWRQSFLAEYFFESVPSSTSADTLTPTLVAVRTPAAKLIKYPGHDEWTELFDLARDPYETKNLVGDPAHQELLERMNAEFDAQVKATDFRIPDYADQPDAAPPKDDAKINAKENKKV